MSRAIRVEVGTLLVRPEAIPEEETEQNWKFLFMYLRGELAHCLSDADRTRIIRHADGFGAVRESSPMFSDWSHVRDSSPQAIRAMCKELKSIMILWMKF